MTGQSDNRRAFTLIELLVVILMITLLASVIVPNYARFNKRAQFRAQAQKIQDIFAYARDQAVSRDTTVTVTYDQQSGSFVATVSPPPTMSDQPAAFVQSDNDAATASSTLPPRTVTIDPPCQAMFTSDTSGSSGGGAGGGGMTAFHFRSDGTVESGTVMLEDRENQYSAVLRLWGATGRMTLEEDPQRQ